MKALTPEMKKDSEVLIINYLTELGVPPNLLGYEYLKVGLSKVLEKPSLIHSVTKELYPMIAEECNSTESRVERAIRHAVEVSFNNLDPNRQEEYFGNSISPVRGKATNSEFLARVAECIRLDLGL